MSPRARTVARELPVVLGLAVLALVLTRLHQAGDSPTFDEPLHVFAGAEYVANGTYGVNLEHPPLMKLLAGLALRPLHLEPPAPGSRVPSAKGEYLRWLYLNRAPAATMIDAARRPFPFLLAALVVLVWGIGFGLFGEGAGVLAAGLLACDPTFVGHAGVVHTDVGAALFVLAAFAAAVAARARGAEEAGAAVATDVPKGTTATTAAAPLARRAAAVSPRVASRALWLVSGLLLGLALATKFSAVLLIPLVLATPLLPFAAPRGERLRALAGACVAVLVGVAVLASLYGIAMRRMSAVEAIDSQASFLIMRDASPALVARIAAVTRIAPPLGQYAAGLAGVSLLDIHGRGANYLLGRVSPERFPLYFPIAFLVKSTPSFLLLTLGLLVLGGRRLFDPWPLALVTAAAFFFTAAARSHFNIGVRHILPVYPLLALAGAGILARRLSPRVFAWTGALLVGGAALTVVRSHPEEIAYFNPIAGGPENAPRWLSDSNIDWGQDLKRLGAVLRANRWEEDTTVVAYSGVATNYYSPRCRVLEPDKPIAPGRYAVSALMEAIGPEFVETFEGEASARQVRKLLARLHARGRRIGRVGASITLWELPGS